MPSSDYTSAVGGGLKLKGAKDAGIDKKKKKKKRAPAESGRDDSDSAHKRSGEGVKEDGTTVTKESNTAASSGSRTKVVEKTEAERQYEEVRRKRLEEKMKRDGVKTHKERVEELNKYLSGLSEHHDMPRIGPG